MDALHSLQAVDKLWCFVIHYIVRARYFHSLRWIVEKYIRYHRFEPLLAPKQDTDDILSLFAYDLVNYVVCISIEFEEYEEAKRYIPHERHSIGYMYASVREKRPMVDYYERELGKPVDDIDPYWHFSLAIKLGTVDSMNRAFDNLILFRSEQFLFPCCGLLDVTFLMIVCVRDLRKMHWFFCLGEFSGYIEAELPHRIACCTVEHKYSAYYECVQILCGRRDWSGVSWLLHNRPSLPKIIDQKAIKFIRDTIRSERKKRLSAQFISSKRTYANAAENRRRRINV
jgi:hypothetical protein